MHREDGKHTFLSMLATSSAWVLDITGESNQALSGVARNPLVATLEALPTRSGILFRSVIRRVGMTECGPELDDASVMTTSEAGVLEP